MKITRTFTALFLTLVLVLFASGCTSRTVKPSTSGKTVKQGPSASSQVTPTAKTNVAVYYIKTTKNDSYLVREVHQIKKTPAIAQAALNELIKGTPVTSGAYNVLPASTRVLGIKIKDGLATVNFSSEVLKANVGARGEELGIASIVDTLTEFPAIQKVSFMVDGQVDKAMDWWGHVGLSQQPFSRNLADVYEPAIWVTTPADNQVIASPVEIRGNAQVFEASVSYRLKDADGNILAHGVTTATEGAPGRGDFQAKLTFKTAGAGKGQIEVYSLSPKDGSELNKVIIPVKWE